MLSMYFLTAYSRLSQSPVDILQEILQVQVAGRNGSRLRHGHLAQRTHRREPVSIDDNNAG